MEQAHSTATVRPTTGKFSLRTLLAVVTAICVFAGVSHYLGIELALGLVLFIVAWANLIVIAALVVGVIHAGPDASAACIGAVIPMAALAFVTFSSGRNLSVFVVGYMTTLAGAYVCRRVRQRLSSNAR